MIFFYLKLYYYNYIMIFNAICAMSNNKGIGIHNKLPWDLKSDLKRFRKLTVGNGNNCIIMGKNTWESTHFLKNRHNYILSSTLEIDTTNNNYEIKSFKDLNSLITHLKNKNFDANWVIGGTKVYETFFNSNLIDYLYLTIIDKSFECDAFFPNTPKYFLKKEMTLHNEKYLGEHNVYYITYEKIKKNQILIYKNIHKCTVKDIHFDDFPDIYITIYYQNKEIQTVAENLKINNQKI